jgi:hypothetical protein
LWPLSIPGTLATREGDAVVVTARNRKEPIMQYAVLLYADVSPDAGPGDPDWDASAQAHQVFNDRIGELGLEKLSSAALHGTARATSLRRRGGERLLTDGPFAETKEQLWGFHILEAPNLDAVLEVTEGLWEAEHGTVEIRPVVRIRMPA